MGLMRQNLEMGVNGDWFKKCKSPCLFLFHICVFHFLVQWFQTGTFSWLAVYMPRFASLQTLESVLVYQIVSCVRLVGNGCTQTQRPVHTAERISKDILTPQP